MQARRRSQLPRQRAESTRLFYRTPKAMPASPCIRHLFQEQKFALDPKHLRISPEFLIAFRPPQRLVEDRDGLPASLTAAASSAKSPTLQAPRLFHSRSGPLRAWSGYP